MNSHSFSRSLVYLSVAVVALVLLLPAAAQAQTPAKPAIGIASNDDVEVQMLGSGLDTTAISYWQVNYTDASGDTKTAVVTDEAGSDEAVGLDSDREGLWKAMYRGCSENLPEGVMTGEDDVRDAISNADCGTDRTAWSPEVMYSHGPPPAPTALEALPAVSGDAITLTWTKSSDTGIDGHDYRYRVSGADEFGDWKDGAASPQRVAMLAAGTTYMFEVRAVGKTTRRSGNAKADKVGPAAMITAVAGGSPVPTLSEVGVLLLGLMLISGGVYYTRRRQTVPQLTA